MPSLRFGTCCFMNRKCTRQRGFFLSFLLFLPLFLPSFLRFSHPFLLSPLPLPSFFPYIINSNTALANYSAVYIANYVPKTDYSSDIM